jgi:hypothetical protein
MSQFLESGWKSMSSVWQGYSHSSVYVFDLKRLKNMYYCFIYTVSGLTLIMLWGSNIQHGRCHDVDSGGDSLNMLASY